MAENGLKATGEDRSFATGPVPADSCPNAAVRAEQGTQTLVLPDCMALEMASPPVKFNHDAHGAQISADGNRVLFTSIADLAGAPGSLGLVGDVYVATRTASGWKTSPTEPPSPLIRGWYNTAAPKSFSPDFSSLVPARRQRTAGRTRDLAGLLGRDRRCLRPALAADETA